MKQLKAEKLVLRLIATLHKYPVLDKAWFSLNTNEQTGIAIRFKHMLMHEKDEAPKILTKHEIKDIQKLLRTFLMYDPGMETRGEIQKMQEVMKGLE